MSKTLKQIAESFVDIQESDIPKVEKLALNTLELKTRLSISLKDRLKVSAPYIKALSLNCLDTLFELEQMGVLDFAEFQNLEILSISYSEKDKNKNTDNDFLERNLKELTKLKSLKSLFINVHSKETEHYITGEITKLMPLFQQLEILRLEIGHNDIRDIGCTTLTNAFCDLKNLKELQLGVEENNLGNYSFENVFVMLSQLDSLEKLQLDFWGNRHDHRVYKTILPILQEKPICQNLKELRFVIDGELHHDNQSEHLLETLTLFKQLKTCFIQFKQVDMNSKTAKGINSILMSNKDTLETFCINLNMKEEKTEKLSNNCITEAFANINQLPKLRNLFLDFYPKQSPQSAIEFFQLLGTSQSINRLGIMTDFTELKRGKLADQVKLFKQIIEINGLQKLEYTKYDYDLDYQWMDEFFEGVWRNKTFIDETLVEALLNKQTSKSQKKKITAWIDEAKQEYLNDEEVDIGSDDEESYGDDDEVDSINESDDQEDEEENQSEEESEEESDEDDEEEKEKVNKQELKILYKSFRSQEQGNDGQYRECIKSLSRFTTQLYFITQRQVNCRRIELLKAIVYQKQTQEIFESLNSCSPQLTRSYWDLLY